MKFTYLCLGAVLFIACQPQDQSEQSNPAMEAFQRNAETVKQDLTNWANESPDYSMYDESIMFYSTSFFTEAPDSTTLEQSMEYDKQNMNIYDFEIMDELNPLPGVDENTKEMDGSVRLYVTWKVTKSATDSTEARSAMLPVYHTYEFNDEGKIIASSGFGDFTGLIRYLDDKASDEGENESEQ